MSYTLFISDLHLDAARPAVVEALGDFLRAHRRCDSLYVLGDIFEAWLGDDDDAPLAFEIARLFSDFTAAGPALYLMQGNRDFLLGQDFCTRVGAKLLDDPTVIDLYGEPTLLMHGDSLCTADEAYQAFRETARNPAWQAELLSKSLTERRELARQLRAASKESNSNKAEDIMDVSPEAVDEHMRKHQCRRLIHGHTHRPARHDVEMGKRWVLGDWEEKGWAIRVSPDDIELYDFSIKQ